MNYGTNHRFLTDLSSIPPNRGMAVRVIAYAAVFEAIQLLYHAISDVPLTAEYAILTGFGGLGSAFLISTMVWKIPVGRTGLLMILWPALFVIQMFADLIEGAFFTTSIPTTSVFVVGALISAAITLAESLTAAYFFQAQPNPSALKLLLGNYFGRKSWRFWVIRLAVGALAYFPIYFFFGALVSPYVIPYYNDPSLGLGLIVPSIPVIFLVEVLRGILFVLVLVPLIAIIRFRKGIVVLFLAAFLYVLGAYIPFVAGTTLPTELRFFHSIEILADSFAYGGVLALIFWCDR